jgi:pectinesterase
MMKRILTFILLLLSIYTYAQPKQITVAQDGSANYKTVQAAFDAVPKYNKKPIVIFVKNGTYREKLHLDSGRNFVELRGESKFNTILIYDDHSGKVSADGKAINTQNSQSVLIAVDNFTARDITFANDAGFTAGQAVALCCLGDKDQFYNCRVVGNQDILLLNNDKGRQYFKDCYLEGTTDFIFGSSAAWFEHCHIHSKKNSHVTAASTPQGNPYGFVFNDCILTGDTTLHMVSLGRPWRPYSMVIYMHCYMGQQIKHEGWSNWNQTESYKTARYAEYQNYGPGSATAGRVSWSKQLSDAEAAEITIKNVLSGWTPLWGIMNTGY